MAGVVRAEVKGILVFDDGGALHDAPEDFTPDDAAHFGATVQIFIGEPGEESSDSFDIVLCTPSWFAERVAAGVWDRFGHGGLTAMPDEVLVGAGLWFVRRWDPALLRAAINSVCVACSPGPDWGTVAGRIGRMIPWEFAYRYDDHVDQRYGEPFPPTSK